MILGVGIDLLNVDRVDKIYSKYKEKILKRILSEEEINYLKSTRKNELNFLAKRFCVKEAFSKAIGSGIGKIVSFKDISCVNDTKGKPYIIRNEKLNNILNNVFGIDFNKISLNVSISDDKNFVNSIVIISMVE